MREASPGYFISGRRMDLIKRFKIVRKRQRKSKKLSKKFWSGARQLKEMLLDENYYLKRF